MNVIKKNMKILFLIALASVASKCSSPSDNTAESKPSVSISSSPAIEGNPIVFSIILSGKSATDTTLDIVTNPETASTTDFTMLATSATIPAGNTSITINIETIDDDRAESTETFTLTATVTSTNTSTATPFVATGTIFDNGNIANEMEVWITKSDQSVLLQKQVATLVFGSTANGFQNINVDQTQTYQSIDGFGYTLTGGSAQVINNLSAAKKTALLQELFGTGENGISISYLRISMGASDLDAAPFSYNDLPNGSTDLSQSQFSLAPDTTNLIPLLQEILTINPNIKIMAVPWSAPAWMKNSFTTIGSDLVPVYYSSYATYFVKYIQAMQALGITIDAVCPQNEPLHGGNNPSMLMTATQQISFIKKLGLAFQSNAIATKIVCYDHNCDKPEYPIQVLNDAVANAYIDGSAFHLYAGDISALSAVHNAHPTKKLYFTEQWTSSTGDFGGDLKWHLKNVIIGSMRNWGVNALEWNLANDSAFGPHTAGGCTQCKGAITINSSSNYTKNVSYYIIGHASKFVPTGSTRIASNLTGNLNNVAFITPSGKKVLIVANDGNIAATFNIKSNEKWVTVALDAGAVGTYIW